MSSSEPQGLEWEYNHETGETHLMDHAVDKTLTKMPNYVGYVQHYPPLLGGGFLATMWREGGKHDTYHSRTLTEAQAWLVASYRLR
jgi:hypothetical protein